MGHAVAGAIRERGGAVRVMTSPYLRCIQTSVPLVALLEASLEIEPRLAEVEHHPGNIAPYKERVLYFPELAEEGASAVAADMSVPEETWPLGYMVRARTYAADLVKELDAEDCGTSTRVLVSHAASVALIAALLGVQLETTLKFAPTGAYVLARDAPGAPWTLLRSGASNEPYVTENSATTYPWGYKPNYLEAWANDHAGKRFPEA